MNAVPTRARRAHCPCRSTAAARLVAFALTTIATVAVARGEGAGAAPRASEGHPSALFALVVGVNASLDADVAPLQYADDDAARYHDLFRALGARTTLLATLDDNTRRLHPQAAAEAQPARRAELRRAVTALARDIAQARERGIRSVLYVIYAGHGDAREGTWRLTLEDGRLDGAALMSEVVTPASADQAHVIVDACQAYLLAFERGPGGSRRPVSGFVELEAASRQGRVGYLLATSTTGETHEWAGFEAGVFSHEIRSGLYGAADADGDGVVSYPEIAAFVTRANAAIASERFRPRIVARAPAGGTALLDVRGLGNRELRFRGADTDAHYLLEDAQGIRLLDFHGARDVPLRLVRPPGAGVLYLRRLPDGAERVVPAGDGVVALESLVPEPPRAGVRGAAHQAFSTIFSLQFDAAVVAAYERDAEIAMRAEARVAGEAARRSRRARIAGWSAVGAGAAALAVATGFELSAVSLRRGAADATQAQALATNDRIASRNLAAGVLAASGIAAVAAGIGVLLWERSWPVAVAPGPTGMNVSATWTF